jgi:hypothetical protein
MDIPQHPKQSISTLTPGPKPQSTDKPSIPVTVEALNLEKGKIYPAVVSKLVEGKTPTLSQPASATPITPPSANEISDWLLKINGKLLLITSEKPLHLGQTLLVKLAPNTQTLSVLPSTPTQPLTTATPNTLLTNTAVVSILLNAINQVMPRQVSLETGLSALELISQQNSSQQVSNQAKLILLILSKQAPVQQLFTETDTTNANVTKTLENALKQSGIWVDCDARG